MSGAKAAKAQSYLARVGSYSTIPKRSGDNTNFAERAWDSSYSSAVAIERIKDGLEVERLIDQEKAKWRALNEEVQKLNSELSTTLPFDKAMRLKTLRSDIGGEIQDCQRKLAMLRKKRHEIHVSSDNFSDVFMQIAYATLPSDVFGDLMEATKKALNK